MGRPRTAPEQSTLMHMAPFGGTVRGPPHRPRPPQAAPPGPAGGPGQGPAGGASGHLRASTSPRGEGPTGFAEGRGRTGGA